MICETMIDAECEESDEAHDLKLLNVLMKCTEEAIEEGNLFDDIRTTTMTTTMWTMTMNRTMIMMTVFVCVIQLILKQAIAVVVPEAKKCNGKCPPDGYNRCLKSQPSYLYHILWGEQIIPS